MEAEDITSEEQNLLARKSKAKISLNSSKEPSSESPLKKKLKKTKPTTSTGSGDNNHIEISDDDDCSDNDDGQQEEGERMVDDDVDGAGVASDRSTRRRRRKPTSLYKDYDMNTEQLKLFQQAVENSRVENINVEHSIDEAPVFRPTHEEFKDPIKYISSISARASMFGIARIIPPQGWKHPTQIKKNSTKKFNTKLQKLKAMQEGRPMGDGLLYTIQSYEDMANKFKEAWLEKRKQHGFATSVTGLTTSVASEGLEEASMLASSSNEGGGSSSVFGGDHLHQQGQQQQDGVSFKSTENTDHDGSISTTKVISFEELESDYWKLIRDNYAGENPEVEYGNDLSTLEYTSGFMKRMDSDPVLGQSTAAFGTEEYYRNCGWNLNNISYWPGSPIRYVSHSIDGINKPWVYHGMLFASFCWHREDIYLSSINYLHDGAPKQWYGIPGDKAKNFGQVLERQMKLRLRDVPDLEHHITTQISPTTLLQNNVPVFKTRQNPGEFIVTFPQAYHGGFSYGFNTAEAVNFATPTWIPHGSQSIVDYRLKKKKEVFSYDRLLFTLSYHLDDFSAEGCAILLKELKAIQRDEDYFRKTLYEAGVRNVSKLVKLPKEGKMSVDIPETLAIYDDQRICKNCKHTCFLSAVCCDCSESKVSCLKCCDFLCGCPKNKQFLLEWHTTHEIDAVVSKIATRLEELKEDAPQL